MFRSALLRRKGVRWFGFGIGCSGVIQMTRDGRRQVRAGRIGVGMVTVVTVPCKNVAGEWVNGVWRPGRDEGILKVLNI